MSDNSQFDVEQRVQVPVQMQTAPGFARGETVEVVDEIGGAYEVTAVDGAQDQTGFVASDDLHEQGIVVDGETDDDSTEDVSEQSSSVAHDKRSDDVKDDRTYKVMLVAERSTVAGWQDGKSVPVEKFSDVLTNVRQLVNEELAPAEDVSWSQIQLGVVTSQSGMTQDGSQRTFGTLFSSFFASKRMAWNETSLDVAPLQTFLPSWDLFSDALKVREQKQSETDFAQVKFEVNHMDQDEKEARLDTIRNSTADGASVLRDYDTFADLVAGTDDEGRMTPDAQPRKWGRMFEQRRTRACEWSDMVFNMTPHADGDYRVSADGKDDTRQVKFGEDWERDATFASGGERSCVYADILDGVEATTGESRRLIQWTPEPSEQVSGEMHPTRARKVAREGSATYGDADSENDFERTQQSYDPRGPMKIESACHRDTDDRRGRDAKRKSAVDGMFGEGDDSSHSLETKFE